MALSKQQKRSDSPSIWTTWMPSAGVVCLVGAHVLAATLGLYSSAPDVKVLQPTTGASITGHLEISVQADDGPTGSGVRCVEYQLDSTTGAWTPLALDLESMTYKGSTETGSVPAGGHELYIRAVDYTGNLRTVFITVSVSAPAARPAGLHPPVPAVDEALDFSSKRSGWGGRVLAAMLQLR